MVTLSELERISLQDLLQRQAQEKRLRRLFVQGGGYPRVSLRGVTLEDVVLHEMDLTEADFQRATLKNVRFEHVHLVRANLSGSTLERVVFLNTEAEAINLREATLRNITVEVSERTFRQADLRGVTLQEIDLKGIKLEGANLEGADLAHAQLQGADLRGVNFRRADLTAANLRGARIQGADFTQAILKETILKETIRDAATKLQQGKYRSRIIADPQLVRELRQAGSVGGELEGQEQVIILGRRLHITFAEGKRKVQEALHGRPSQQHFREDILSAYNHRCALTGCEIPEILEAAHIIPFALDPRNNKVGNGVLLRADIHALFDLNLLEIEPQTGLVYLHPRLQEDALYQGLHQKIQVSPPLLGDGYQKAQCERDWRQALKWRHDEYQRYLED